MDNLEKGSWIINTIKHTTGVRTDTVELNDLEVTERAGKSGILLGKLLVDKQEIITGKKLSVFARTANISPDAVKTYAEILKNFGQVDFKLDKFGNVSELEIYCLTTEDAIKTVSDIFEYYEPDEIERGNLESLKTTFEFPASREELTQALTSRKGISEENVNEILALESAFSLIKKERIENSDIYYNEYAFAGDGSKIAKAIASLPESQRNDVNFVMEQVKQSQGFLADNLTDKINPNIISMMEGVGLLDGITVNSDFGKAVFYTTPQLIGPGIGSWKISTDVFNALLDICRDVFGMSQELREKYISTKLTYGDSEATYINGLIESVTRYANEMLAEKIPKEYYNKNLVERMEIPAPHYTKNCIAIIERAYNNPEWYIDMLRNIDFILFEFMLKNQKFDYTLFSEHCKNYLVNEKLKACKNVLFFICSSAAVHLGDIWKEENDFVPQKIHNIEN